MFQTASRHLKCPCRNRERCFAVGLTHVWVSSRSVYSNRHDMEWKLLQHRGSGSTAEVIQCRADKSSDLWEGSNGASGSGATAVSYWIRSEQACERCASLNWTDWELAREAAEIVHSSWSCGVWWNKIVHTNTTATRAYPCEGNSIWFAMLGHFFSGLASLDVLCNSLKAVLYLFFTISSMIFIFFRLLWLQRNPWFWRHCWSDSV